MIVVLSHAHPSVSKGGAEVSAYTLYAGLRQLGVPAAFVATVPEADMDRVAFDTPDEYVVPFRHDDYDHVFHCAPASRYAALRELIDPLGPTALVFHHFLFLGANTVRDLVSHYDCPSALVLHEFLAICSHHGQMVTHPRKLLCSAASPAACAACFPQFSPEHFHVRRHHFLQAFEPVDHLISPSRFLAERFVDWGVAPQKMHVIENGLKSAVPAPARPGLPSVVAAAVAESAGRRRLVAVAPAGSGSGREPAPPQAPKVFGYFGQINPFKGMDLLLDALDILAEQGLDQGLRIRIHGNVVGVSDEFKSRFEQAVQKYRTVIDYQGPYQNPDVLRLMAACDYVLMASRWWENSPVVIQEAFAAKRPLVVPDIGGMAEKVRDGESGRHFRAGDATDLARVLRECVAETGRYTLPVPLTATGMAQAYQRVLNI